MAGFKTHVTVGTFTGFFLAIVSYIAEWVTSFGLVSAIFFATMAGSFLPDLDSDTGLPYQIIFGLYALLIAGLTFYLFYNISNGNVILSFISPVLAFVIIRYVLGPLFKRYTKHRGIFHSIPAALISFFATLLIVSLVNMPVVNKFLIALAVGIGYLSHLVLDEIFSTNILIGKIKKPKKSLGTALKFGAKSRTATLIAYILLFVLIFLTYPMMQKILINL